MRRNILSSIESAAAMGLGLASLGCGGAIEGAANGWAMLGWTALAVILGGVAVALLGLAVANCQGPSQSRLRRASSPKGGARGGLRAAGARSGRKAG